MAGTIEHESTAGLDADSLLAAWRERVAADAALGPDAIERTAHADDAFGGALAALVARSLGASGAAVGDESEAALAAGRAAFAGRLDLPGLQRLLGHLHDVVTARLLERASDADGHLSTARAEKAVRRVRDAMERIVVEATRGWFDEAGRKLRHDVKTPLQATSLNLELLTLETAERGLDTEPLDTIQRSLDQVVDLLSRAEPARR